MELNDIGDDGAEAVAGVCVVHLELGDNNIGRRGALAIANGLKNHNKIKTLKLGRNNISDESAKSIVNALNEHTSIKVLDLSSNSIAEKATDAIGELLNVTNNIKHLALGDNNIGDGGALAIVNGLKKHNTIEILSLSNNWIADAGAEVIAELLKENKSIKHLDLGFNNIGDIGAEVIANGLKKNTNVKILNLSNNCIADEGAGAFAELLKENYSINHLNLCCNIIGSRGAAKFANVLETRETNKIQLELFNNTCLRSFSSLIFNICTKGFSISTTYSRIEKVFHDACISKDIDIIKYLLRFPRTPTLYSFTTDELKEVLSDQLATDTEFYSVLLKRLGCEKGKGEFICDGKKIEDEPELLQLLLFQISRAKGTILDELRKSHPFLKDLNNDLLKKVPLDTVRLHLCGPGCGGKTTLKYQIMRENGKLRELVEKPVSTTRTAGMEIHKNIPLNQNRDNLSVSEPDNSTPQETETIKGTKINIFDHGGQQEFHVTYSNLVSYPLSVFVIIIPVCERPVFDKTGASFHEASTPNSVCCQL